MQEHRYYDSVTIDKLYWPMSFWSEEETAQHGAWY